MLERDRPPVGGRALEGFRARHFDYTLVTPTEVASRAKCETRRLYADPVGGVFVAETVSGGQVRETEAILTAGRADGAFDFFAYDAEGKSTNRSEFPTTSGDIAVGALPYVCMSCHFTPRHDGWTFDRFSPDTGVCERAP